eukprot:GHVU01178793.1.p2 GENE.GHVU01178793.1~~GHVU01178793.1.p2  ORF type:complete len:122 (+),score=26.15 GHVU01178793.1:288-653(+)
MIIIVIIIIIMIIIIMIIIIIIIIMIIIIMVIMIIIIILIIIRVQQGIPVRFYYLFGAPIRHSPSPDFHNTIFALCGLPHRYTKSVTHSVSQSLGDSLTHFITRRALAVLSVVNVILTQVP